MKRAVYQPDSDIDHRVSGQSPSFHGLNDPFFHSRDIFLGDHASDNFIFK